MTSFTTGNYITFTGTTGALTFTSVVILPTVVADLFRFHYPDNFRFDSVFDIMLDFLTVFCKVETSSRFDWDCDVAMRSMNPLSFCLEKRFESSRVCCAAACLKNAVEFFRRERLNEALSVSNSVRVLSPKLTDYF